VNLSNGTLLVFVDDLQTFSNFHIHNLWRDNVNAHVPTTLWRENHSKVCIIPTALSPKAVWAFQALLMQFSLSLEQNVKANVMFFQISHKKITDFT
jgi:hypothetical protein